MKVGNGMMDNFYYSEYRNFINCRAGVFFYIGGSGLIQVFSKNKIHILIYDF
jgi:hypothetical protein